MESEITVNAQFPGGNILVDDIRGDTVYIRADLRDTETPWFYWYFEVAAPAGKEITFCFPTDHPFIASRGPAVSLDGGESWDWLSPTPDFPEHTFSYVFPQDAGPIRFAVAPPYTSANLQRLIERLPATWQVGTLCLSRSGREVPTLTTPGRGKPLPTVIVVARQHACEVAGSYVLEGMLETWLDTENSPPIIAIPFMDIDGVENGDQGKNRHPRDHNRDYVQPHIYTESAALMHMIAGIQGPVALLDLHCPWIRGGQSERVHIVGLEDPKMEQTQRVFTGYLQDCAKELPFHTNDFVAFGTEWNVAESYARGKTLTAWVAEQPNCCFTAVAEIPYANATGHAVNARSARGLGRDLAAALRSFLEAERP